jgi:3-deoxy-D-manno-octulosonic acid kinase
MLELVRSLGVSAPKPLVYVKKGSYVYSTWLVMEHIANTRTLVEVAQHSPDVVPEVMGRLADQLRILLSNRVLHVDLHPGNVLIHDDLRVTIVDFDKALIFPGSAEALCDLYLRRWRRAVIKHSLPPILSELISLTLRSYHE